MLRREFLVAGAAGITASMVPAAAAAGRPAPARGAEPFALKFAPHFGMFRHHAKDDVDQLQFAHDEGFRAWEDNGMGGRSVEDQERLAKKMSQLGIEMGVFVAHGDFGAPTFASGKQEHVDRVLADMKKAVEIAKRVNAKWCTVVPGTVDHRQDMGYQTANAVELLKRCCDIVGPAGLTMVMEPLNFRDHPELFLTKVPQGYQICRAVGSPHCKILDDLYHQQITEGNLIPNMDRAWSEIAYFQSGDNPGRCEPETGEIHYRNVFRHIRDKGFTGIIGMEHGNKFGGKEGERKLIDAYRHVNPA
ncbi:MAG: hypothetical protein RL148_2025 [Planctomycetota bacterium]|jgi:hydroxypyruvate isomerase